MTSVETGRDASLLRSRLEVCPAHDSLVAAFEAAARVDAPFVTLHGSRGPVARPIREALGAARRWSAALHGRGVRRGDRVPLLMPTGHAFVEAMLGSMLAGAVPVPLATPMTFGNVDRYLRNLAAVVADCDARILVTYRRIAEAIAGDPGLQASLRDVLTEDALDGLGSEPHPTPSIGASDTAFIQYTSGTTGSPKGAVISQGALVANAFAIASGLEISPRDVGVSWLPLFHDMGLVGVLLTSICHPYPVHVMSPESFVMSPRRWLELIAKVGATLSPAPNFAYDFCVSRGGDPAGLRLDSWRVALNGAEPVHTRTVARFSDRFAPAGFQPGAMMPVYGMAEATLAVTFPPLDDALTTAAEVVSVGEPVAGMCVEVVDDAGHIVPEGQIGQILVSGPSLMDGYFRNDSASASTMVGRRLRSGDLGFVCEGRLYVTGRAKELIIKGGRNLHPADVERVAAEVEGVRSGCVAAFGRANAETGTDDLVVVIETSQTDEALRGAIASGVRSELLGVLGVKPDEIRLSPVGSVPRTTSGKIRRGECARIFRAEGRG